MNRLRSPKMVLSYLGGSALLRAMTDSADAHHQGHSALISRLPHKVRDMIWRQCFVETTLHVVPIWEGDDWDIALVQYSTRNHHTVKVITVAATSKYESPNSTGPYYIPQESEHTNLTTVRLHLHSKRPERLVTISGLKVFRPDFEHDTNCDQARDADTSLLRVSVHDEPRAICLPITLRYRETPSCRVLANLRPFVCVSCGPEWRTMHPTNETELLWTCRQVSNEALPALYGASTFVFNTEALLRRFLCETPTHLLKHVQHLCIEIDSSNPAECVNNLEAHLQQFPNVVELRLVLFESNDQVLSVEDMAAVQRGRSPQHWLEGLKKYAKNMTVDLVIHDESVAEILEDEGRFRDYVRERFECFA